MLDSKYWNWNRIVGSLGDFVVALTTVDVVSIQSQTLKGWDGLQHLIHICWFHLCWASRWLRV